MSRRHALTPTAASLVGLLALAGCKLDPECFGRDDCTSGFVCSRGRCALPDAMVAEDGAVGDAEADAGPDTGIPPVDAGQLDAGPVPDMGFFDATPPDLAFPDAQRPDLGIPDASFADSGLLMGPMPAGTHPLVGSSTPTAVAIGFSDLQNVSLLTSTGTLVLSDVTGDVMYTLEPSTGHTVGVQRGPSLQANGTARHPLTQDLLVCEQGGRRLRVQPAGGGVDLPLLEDFFQYRFNSPDDIVVRSDGTVYFTDPPFGLAGRTRDMPFNGLFRFGTNTATLTAEWMGIPGTHAPDGLALSPAEDRLYMSEVGGRVILVFDVDAAGRLSNRRALAQTHGITPNGLAVDDDGNVYVATSIGIEVFGPNGYYWGNIAVGGTVSDLTFAPPNRSRIYATTTSTVFAIDVPVAGPLR